VNRLETVRAFVLAEISDDFEEPEHVYENVAEISRTCGLSVDRAEVLGLLHELVELGLAKAYLLSPRDPVIEVKAPLLRDRMSELYFWITEDGVRALSTWRRDWRMSDEGVLLPDCLPPSV